MTESPSSEPYIQTIEANGRKCAYLSELGKHTIENSDALFVNPELGLKSDQDATILSMVVDGATYDFDMQVLAQELMTGKFVAQRIANLLPGIFDDLKTIEYIEARLKHACWLTAEKILEDFKGNFMGAFQSDPGLIHLSGLAAVAGVIETPGEIVLFSFGDSQSVFLSESGGISVFTDSIHVGDSSVWVHLSRCDDGSIVDRFGFADEPSIKIVPKASIKKGARVVSYTDGLVPDGDKQFLVRGLRESCRSPEEAAVKKVYDSGLAKDELWVHYKDYAPDDKTVVLTTF